MKTLPIAALKKVLQALVEVSVDTGVADDTSLVTRLDDSAKAWPVNAFTDLIVEITAGTGEGQVRKIDSNTATSLVPVTNFATAPDATSQYRIGFYGKMTSDIASWGGTAVTGRDITTDIQKLTTGIEVADRAARLLGVVYGSQAQKLLQRATTYDLLIQLRHAGAEVDPRAIRALTSSDVVNLSDKWARQLGLVDISRVLGAALSATNPVIARLTDGTAVITSPIKTQLPAALTTAGNLKQSVEERLILKTIRDIAPGATGNFWLPETGNIDLSKYLASSWGIYAPTTTDMVINCYLNISHDGGTTWRRAAGYEILDADFVRDVWNTIDCPLKLAEAKLEVVIATAYPAELDMMCIAKP